MNANSECVAFEKAAGFRSRLRQIARSSFINQAEFSKKSGGVNMSRFRQSFLLTLAFLFCAGPLLASNFVVGNCKPKLPTYSTISAAVAAAPAGSTVMICPGTYPEQISISQSLTLEGISLGDSAQVVVSVPSPGLVVNALVNGGANLAPQILVIAGQVNISNITVDGTGNNLNGSVQMAGIYYTPGSSGVIDHVTTRNQIDSTSPTVQGLGTGIWIENGTGVSESITIENCSVHDFDGSGIFVNDPDLTATIKGNNVNASNATFFVFAILVLSSGTVTNNTVAGPGTSLFAQGITVQVPSATVSNNLVTDWNLGIVDFNAATYTNNTVVDTSDGMILNAPGTTANANTVMTASDIGIYFNCNSDTVLQNTINDATFGLASVPSSFSSANAFLNVATLRTGGCADASATPESSKASGRGRAHEEGFR
jgi:hypothetical protein